MEASQIIYLLYQILDDRRKKLREAAKEMAKERKEKKQEGSAKSKFSIDQLLDKVGLSCALKWGHIKPLNSCCIDHKNIYKQCSLNVDEMAFFVIELWIRCGFEENSGTAIIVSVKYC